MADAFHATFKPGTTINVTDTLVISFDKPKEADPVTVTLSEVDAWVSDGKKVVETANSADVLIAEFTGKIVGGKFVGTQSKPKPAATGSPALKVQFDGEPAGSSHTLQIPASTAANEEGIFEVLLKVNGTVAKKPGSFVAPTPVFVRNFNQKNRPVIAFITGSDNYFTAARKFMETYADATISRDNVLDIREFLRTQSAPRGFGPWGEVNIVDHGNALEWVIKLVPGDTEVRHLRKWHVAEAIAQQPAFQRPITSVLDSNSTVVIRGCSIGNDQGLLDEIRKLFGGQCKVLAPKFIQEYEFKGSNAREGFFEFLHFYSTTGPANGDATVPTDAQCRTALKAKFPNPVPPISDAEWLTFLGRRTLNRDGFRGSDASGQADRKETIPWKQVLTVKHPAGQKAQAVAAANAFDWRGKAEAAFDGATPKENLETKFSDWHFVEGPLEEEAVPGGTKFTKKFKGTRIRIEIRRELRDAKGTPVKPDPTNKDHYGSSP